MRSGVSGISAVSSGAEALSVHSSDDKSLKVINWWRIHSNDGTCRGIENEMQKIAYKV